MRSEHSAVEKHVEPELDDGLKVVDDGESGGFFVLHGLDPAQLLAGGHDAQDEGEQPVSGREGGEHGEALREQHDGRVQQTDREGGVGAHGVLGHIAHLPEHDRVAGGEHGQTHHQHEGPEGVFLFFLGGGGVHIASDEQQHAAEGDEEDQGVQTGETHVEDVVGEDCGEEGAQLVAQTDVDEGQVLHAREQADQKQTRLRHSERQVRVLFPRDRLPHVLGEVFVHEAEEYERGYGGTEEQELRRVERRVSREQVLGQKLLETELEHE